MIRCLAVDDEAYASKIIADYIGKCPFLMLAGTTTSAVEALTLVQQGQIDLVFLDIQMPDLTGLQFLQLCRDKCKVILITAYPEYALQGYEYDVIDYLLKPVEFARFLKAVHKALPYFQQAGSEVVTPVQQQPAQPVAITTSSTFLFVKGDSKNKFFKIDHKDILFIEGLKNYVSIYTAAKRIITYQRLSDLEEQLPQPPFYRIHKSYIISLDKITMIDGNAVFLGDHSVSVGDTYRSAFLDMIRDKK